MLKTGIAFPDYITSEKPRSSASRHFDKPSNMRVFFMPLLLVLAAVVIFFRLFDLQIIQGSYYRDLSDNNRIRTVVIHAPRGIIFDRNKDPLVFNVPGFRETINGKTRVIDNEKAITLIAQGKKDLEVDALRSYPYKDIFAHVVGYIGQIDKEELKESKFSAYKGGDLIGKMGVEQEYETFLKGIDGKQLLETDSLGKSVRKLGQTDPIPGKDLTFTLDAKLQKTAFEALKNVKKGTVIVSTPNGEVLSMVSKPSFDPNLFTMGQDYRTDPDNNYQTIEQALTDNNNQPLLNRSISGVYPPGSTFKLIVAASGLENKIIDRSYEVEDTGIINVGSFSFSNWYYSQYGRKDGAVDVIKGIKRSNDIFFYKLGEKIGVEKISKTAEKFGLGERLGIDLAGEAAGNVPTPLWKEKEIGEQWYLGDTYHYGIGQGYVLTTPLQVNIWTQAISNEGIIYKPHLLMNTKPMVFKKDLLSPDSADLIRQGMVESCSPGGVAWPLFNFTVKNEKLKVDGKNFLEAPQSTTSGSFKDYRKISIACKTGTAQHGTEKTLPHAWITLFAPAYDPQIIVTVLAEESGEGSNIATPIAKKVLEEWFSRE
ncbi:MAG: hypothetical protein HYT08_05195 [Candidatus Levybacteria bacterium]|nr:hypothetical protein [Candidatus Levybacteria bacterium]